MRHHSKGNAPAAASDGSNVILACGEKAVAPSAKIQSIVAQINGAWGSNVQVYQSVAIEGPHSIGGGCILYNPAGLAMLLGMRLNLNDPNVLTPMLYAIFAHEVGTNFISISTRREPPFPTKSRNSKPIVSPATR